MTTLFNVYSCLLTYPDDELLAALPAITATLEAADALATVQPLLDLLQSNDLISLQENYVATFDRTPSHSLHIFEHVHGESRDRGQAMVDLMGQYQEAGFEISVKELPDYLPLYLEFLAYQASVINDDIQIRMDIADVSHILALLAARLEGRGSLYKGCFNALLQIAGKPLDIVEEYQEQISKEKRDDSFEALDKEWEEEVVTFLDAQQEERCPSQTSTQNLAAKAGIKNTSATNAVDAPVHWVDFKTNQPVKS